MQLFDASIGKILCPTSLSEGLRDIFILEYISIYINQGKKLFSEN
jgi:hypothetical protein